jgi:Abortive infection alpha
MTEPIEPAIAKEVAKLIPRLYGDALAPAVTEVGQALRTAVRAARAVLLPLDYIAALAESVRFRLAVDVAARLHARGLDPAHLEPPPRLLAEPLIGGFSAAVEEGVIRHLYAALLVAAMTPEQRDRVHPALCHIVQQLSPDEAHVLKRISEQDYSRDSLCCDSRDEDGKQDDPRLEEAFESLCVAAGVEVSSNAPTYLANLVRLRLLEIQTFYAHEDPGLAMDVVGWGGALPPQKKLVEWRDLVVAPLGVLLIETAIL